MVYGGHAERREHILTAAAGLLAESGMARLSVRAVAEAAGVGMGTLRHYFPSQRELHHALVVKLVDDRTRDFAIHDTRQPAADRLARCLLQYLPADDTERPLLDAWFGLYRVGLDPNGPPFARQFLEVSATRSRERIRAWLELLAAEGHFLPDTVRRHGQRLNALVTGVCLELVTPGSGLSVAEARDLVREAVTTTVGGTDT